jgi:hypothetical protein
MFAFLLEIFCLIDDFCKHFGEYNNKFLLIGTNRQQNRPCNMGLSEIMTIVVLFHVSQMFVVFYKI